MKNGKLHLEQLSLERFLASQQGSFNHRYTGLSVRMKQAKKQNIPTPPKRFGNEKLTIDFKIVQLLRMKVRRKSLEVWIDTPRAISFDKKMKKHLTRLHWSTRVYHHKRAIIMRIKRIISKYKQR